MPAGVMALDDAATLERLFAPVADAGALGLAVSGGMDSLALMLLAKRWASPRGVTLVVYSVDHGLRSEAAGEVALVLGLAGQLGLAARGLRWPGPHPQTGVQQQARLARYRLMGAAMRGDGVGTLLTAHHLHDQAETVLMRMAHGSGLEGLAGMARFSAVEGVRIFRPLLNVAPERLYMVVVASGWTPVDDPSNRDEHYERVRWRGLLAPLDRLGLTPARLAQLARRAGAAQAAVNAAALAADASVVLRATGLVRLERLGFAALPEAVGVALLARLLQEMGEAGKARALGPIERLRLALLEPAPFRTRTLHGCSVRRTDALILVQKEPGRRLKAASPAAMQPSRT